MKRRNDAGWRRGGEGGGRSSEEEKEERCRGEAKGRNGANQPGSAKATGNGSSKQSRFDFFFPPDLNDN